MTTGVDSIAKCTYASNRMYSFHSRGRVARATAAAAQARVSSLASADRVGRPAILSADQSAAKSSTVPGVAGSAADACWQTVTPFSTHETSQMSGGVMTLNAESSSVPPANCDFKTAARPTLALASFLDRRANHVAEKRLHELTHRRMARHRRR